MIWIRRTGKLQPGRLLAVLGVICIVLSPMLYNSLVITLSADMTAGWLSTYSGVIDHVVSFLRIAWPGPGQIGHLLNLENPQRALLLEQFAYIDTLLACIGVVTATIGVTATAIPTVETFSPKHGRQRPRGSWISFGILSLFAIGLCTYLWISLFQTGLFFSGIGQHCARYSAPFFSRYRHCVGVDDSTFAEMIAQLGYGVMTMAFIASTLFSWTISAGRAAFRKSFPKFN